MPWSSKLGIKRYFAQKLWFNTYRLTVDSIVGSRTKDLGDFITIRNTGE